MSLEHGLKWCISVYISDMAITQKSAAKLKVIKLYRLFSPDVIQVKRKLI